MLTRRDVLRFAAGLPVLCAALPAASKDFWEAKPASDWTADEIDRMLTKSPWAKDASVMSNGPGFGNGGSGRSRGGGIGFPGGGGVGFPGGGVGFPGGGRHGGGYPGGGHDGGGRERLAVAVRWESALPIQEALRIGAGDEKPNADFEKYYVLALIGDLAASSGRRRSSDNSDDDDDSRTRSDWRIDELKESARLERKDGPIRLEKVEEGSRVGSRGPGVYFYFARKDDVSMGDKFVNFSTKLGRMEIKAKFIMKEMVYHGKLAV
jgi:hypothetical protein